MDGHLIEIGDYCNMANRLCIVGKHVLLGVQVSHVLRDASAAVVYHVSQQQP